MEFSYSQTENFEMKKLSSDTGYFKKPVEINRGLVSYKTNNQLCALHGTYILHTYGYSHLAWHFYKLQWSETLLLACKCIFMNKDSSISTTHISKYLLTLDSKINVIRWHCHRKNHCSLTWKFHALYLHKKRNM